MRIAILAMQFPKTSETFVINHICSLLDRGHDVAVFTLGSEEEDHVHHVIKARGLMNYVRPLDRTVSSSKAVLLLRRMKLLMKEGWKEPRIAARSLDPRIGAHTAYNLALYAQGTAFAADRARFDIVHCHFAWSGIVGARLKAAGAFDAKLVITLHGSDVNALNPIGSLRQRKLMFSVADRCTANTNFIMRRAIELGCPPDRCSIWRMGVSLDDFPLRLRAPGGNGPIRIITVARLVESKGIDFAIRAIKILTDAQVDAEFHIIGAGPLRSRLEHLASELGMAQRVIFHGACSSQMVREHLWNSDIFVLASITAVNNASEGQPVSLIEAQACGLPVIATRVGGVSEALRDNESGFLIPERDTAALADRLTYLAGSAELRQKMGLAGRQFVEREYSLDKCTDTIMAIYERVQTKKR